MCRRNGIVDSVDAERIIVRVTSEVGNEIREAGVDIYKLTKFQRSNQNTCINQKPLVKQGDRVGMGQILADGPCTEKGELALGRNILVARLFSRSCQSVAAISQHPLYLGLRSA